MVDLSAVRDEHKKSEIDRNTDGWDGVINSKVYTQIWAA